MYYNPDMFSPADSNQYNQQHIEASLQNLLHPHLFGLFQFHLLDFLYPLILRSFDYLTQSGFSASVALKSIFFPQTGQYFHPFSLSISSDGTIPGNAIMLLQFSHLQHQSSKISFIIPASPPFPTLSFVCNKDIRLSIQQDYHASHTVLLQMHKHRKPNCRILYMVSLCLSCQTMSFPNVRNTPI